MKKNKIAVISDIHGNAESLKYVLNELSKENLSLTIVLGDLLTYGCQPNEVVSMLIDYKKNSPTVFIKGNHDQFYFDLADKKPYAGYQIPDFAKESIQWTEKVLVQKNLKSAFDWKESFSIHGIYFSHANPYEYGNWEYVDSHQQHLKAFDVLKEKRCVAGVFGHSHRQKFVQMSPEGLVSGSEQRFLKIPSESFSIINIGSIGQPRGKGFCYLLLEHTPEFVQAEFREFNLCMSYTISLIAKSDLSNSTKDKLISYLGA